MNVVSFVGIITRENEYPTDHTPEAHARARLAGCIGGHDDEKENIAEYLRNGLSMLENFGAMADSEIESIKYSACQDRLNEHARETINEIKEWKKASRKVNREEFLIALAEEWVACYAEQ